METLKYYFTAAAAFLVLLTSVSVHAEQMDIFNNSLYKHTMSAAAFKTTIESLRTQADAERSYNDVNRSYINALIYAARNSKDEQIVQAGKEEKTSAEIDFEGLGFDAGLSVLLPSGDKPIREAELKDGKVHITKSGDTSIVPVLQLHQFWTAAERKFGYGPFSAIGFGEDKVIKTISIGIMVGYRKSADSPQSINIGVGYYWEPNATFLADGYVDGEQAPTGATKAETVEKTAKGLAITLSYKF